MDKLYCIKMLARQGENHLCGGERLGSFEEIDSITSRMMQRVVAKGMEKIDSVDLNVFVLEHFNFRSAGLPDLIILPVKDYREGRNTARNLLFRAGVSTNAFNSAVNLLKKTYGSGGKSIPGAFLLDSFTGEILNPHMADGVWIGRVDLANHVEKKLLSFLLNLGLDGTKIRDNLVLSAKIMGQCGIIGEMNWSNDSREPGGSVSTPELGYAYFPFLRSTGHEVGGKVLFSRAGNLDLDSMLHYLESEVLIIDNVGNIR